MTGQSTSKSHGVKKSSSRNGNGHTDTIVDVFSDESSPFSGSVDGLLFYSSVFSAIFRSR